MLKFILVVFLVVLTAHVQAQCGPAHVPLSNSARSASHAKSQFAFALLQASERATPNANVFLSPDSIYNALLLAYYGAGGTTQQQLVRGLNLQWATDKQQVSSVVQSQKRVRQERLRQIPLTLSSASKIFFANDIKLNPNINALYADEVESLDFRGQPEQSRQYMNRWVAQQTHNEIPEMLSARDVSPATQLVPITAAYFKGQWAQHFDAAETQKEIFYTSISQQVFVDMMHVSGKFNVTTDERLGAHVLQLPYRTSQNEVSCVQPELSMIILLPPFVENGLENVISKLTPEALQQSLRASRRKDMEITVPKFKFEQTLQLLPILRKMGMTSMFEQTADLSGFSTQTNFMFGDVKHVAKIKVDEEGSTAAAATALFSFRLGDASNAQIFVCNHPFVFLIYEHSTRDVLFAGIFREPAGT